LDKVWNIWAPLRKLFVPHRIPSWLRACFSPSTRSSVCASKPQLSGKIRHKTRGLCKFIFQFWGVRQLAETRETLLLSSYDWQLSLCIRHWVLHSTHFTTIWKL